MSIHSKVYILSMLMYNDRVRAPDSYHHREDPQGPPVDDVHRYLAQGGPSAGDGVPYQPGRDQVR